MALLDTIVQSIALSIFSNVLAQLISAHQENTPYTNLDPGPIGQFVIYTIVNVPINWYWQDLLESLFPSQVPVKSTAEKDKGEPKTAFSVPNTVIKFLTDQTLGAIINIPLFIATIGLVKGQSVDQILTAIQRDAVDIYFAGLKLWPAVSLINFAFVPVHRRVIFGSLAGVIWNIYLSLMVK